MVLFVCGGWQFPGHADAQAANDATSASQQLLVPLARGVLGQPMNDKAEVEAGTVVPVVAARWTAAEEAQLWLSAIDAKLAAAGVLVLLAGLFAGAGTLRSSQAHNDVSDSSSEINRPSYI